MKPRSISLGRFVCVLGLAVWATGPEVFAQTPLRLSIRMTSGHAQITITGAASTTCQIQWTDTLTTTSRWFHLSHYVVTGSSARPLKDATAGTSRFYRAVWTPNTNVVWIPPGIFTMGSPTDEVDRNPNEGPQTVVRITRGFWMGKYEVTQGDYLSLMATNPSYFNGDRSGPPWFDQNFGTNLTLPVEQVSWNDATNYCARLTAQERAAGRIPANSFYRLPTEAEWEYACRAGTATRFYYGDDPGYTNLAGYAWYSANSQRLTQRGGQLLANPWGLYDMAGNVWEWCQDFYAVYPGGNRTDPSGPANGTFRVWRGGSWSYTGQYSRAARRMNHLPTFTYDSLGFRVVLIPAPP